MKTSTKSKSSTGKSGSRYAPLQSLPFSKRYLFIFLGLGLILVGIFAYFANASTSSCGQRVANYTYQVPWGKAVWNQPVCGLPRHPRSADYAERFYKWSNINDGTAASSSRWGRLDISADFPKPLLTDPEGLAGLFSRNVYYAKDATTTIKVHATVYPSNLDGEKSEYSSDPDRLKYFPDTPIPWNPDWRTGEGGDNEIVILDQANGKIYEISGYKRGVPAIAQGCLITDRLCSYTVNIGRDNNGAIIDYRTFEGPLNRRGVGLSMYATLTTPEEILAGEIRHALGIGIPNTATGPICTVQQQGTTQEGTTCGTALAPASKFEWGGKNSIAERANIDPKFYSLYTQDKLIPEGMRFALDIDDAYIENWIKSRPEFATNPRKAQTARVFARALRDYGFMPVDTNGAGASVQIAGMVNPQSRELWKQAGIESDKDNNLLDGLIKQEKLYVLDAPQQTCVDGKVSKYFCKWLKASYPTLSSTTTTPNPTTTVTTTVSPTTTITPSSPPPTTTISPSPNPTTTTASQCIPSAKQSCPTTSPQPVKDTTPPSIPQNIKAEAVADVTKLGYNLRLTWTPSTDNVAVSRYLIERNTTQLPAVTTSSFTDNDISPTYTNTYTIRASDAAGNVSLPARTAATIKCFLIWCWAE